MTINRKICPAGLKNNPNRAMKKIDYITIHNTGNYNASATAKMHANYQYTGSEDRQASWHYTVDKEEIWQSFEDKNECWHATDGSGPGNTASIGIEICVNDKAGFKDACENTARLAAELLKQYGLGVDRVVQHNKWYNKNCPAELRSGAWGMTWDAFISLVRQYLRSEEQVKNPIMGAPVLSARQLAAFLRQNNPSPKINCTPDELAALFIAEGKAEGVRGDFAFCQSAHETGFFKYGGQVLPEQNNYCGLGATNGSAAGKGAWFETPELGVRAQIQHLKAYASKDVLVAACVDPRFGLVTRGVAANWEDLAGRWAVPGYDAKKYPSFEAAYAASATYGQTIRAIYDKALKVECPEDEPSGCVTLAIDGKIISIEAENVSGHWRAKIRDVLAAAGYTITWEAASKTIRADKG